MELLQRLLISVALVAALLLLRMATRRRPLPAPPWKLLVLALAVWTLFAGVHAPGGIRWLGVIDDLAFVYALISLGGWLVLDCPPALGWWEPVAKILRDLLGLGIGGIATVVLLQRQANLNLVGLVTTSAVLTAVIGLAAQETLKDLFAGIELQVDPPFRVGDWIEVGDSSGTVVSLTLMSTELQRTDSSLVTLPNSKVADAPMRRFSQRRPAGNRFAIALGYEIPPHQARLVLERVLAQHPLVLQEPPPVAWISSYDNAVVRYELMAHHRNGSEKNRLQMRSDLMEQIWYALEREGWTLPYPVQQWQRASPQRDPHHPAATDAPLAAAMLRRSWLFAQLEPAQVEQLAPAVRCLRFGPGETIVREGDEGNALFQVVNGEVEVFKQDGTELGRSVAVLGRDQIFGEMTLCTGEPRTATVRSRRECVLLEVERTDLLPLVEADTGLLQELSRIVAQRRAELESLSSPDAAARQVSILQRMRHIFAVARGPEA